ncbi:MAG: (2Fe-2S)-binding protein [Planctomycetota bacterium]
MSFTLNGKKVDMNAHPLARLLDVLRVECGLTGTKEGCGEGECGACTVLVNNKLVNSCLVPFVQVRDAKITTIEGLKGKSKLQKSFIEHGAAQCGFCTPGMILAASKIQRNANINEVKCALAGNLCRCTGYTAIYSAIADANKAAK